MEESISFVNQDGDTIWYLPSKGKSYWHQLDRPAIEYANGSKSWFVNGERHRLDGAAIESADGSKSWFVNGNHLPIDEVEEWLLENEIDLSTEIGQMAFKLRWYDEYVR